MNRYKRTEVRNGEYRGTLNHKIQRLSTLIFVMALVAGCGSGRPHEQCTEGCLIDAICHESGTFNPDNLCQRCAPEHSNVAWSDNDDTSCDDGLYCTVDDTCSAGECVGTPRDCSDGIDCNGAETCHEDASSCQPGEFQCSSEEFCDMLTGDCVSTCPGCVIENQCYGDGQLNPSNPCQHCDVDQFTESWTDNDGARCDDELFCTIDDTCTAGECRGAPRSCDDGVDCNGPENCDETAEQCLRGEPTCEDDELCDPRNDSCVTTCTGCVINGVCYGDGQLNPTNPCEHCAVDRSTDRWSDNDGARCDDELFCTVDDTCSAGECHGTTRSCADDVDCNGAESCDEAADLCLPGVPTCSDGEFCDPSTDRCVTACTGCIIGGTCYGDGQLNPTNPCEHCAVDRSTDRWSNNDGARCDDEAFCTVDDTCTAGECHGTSRSCADDVDCNGIETCAEAINACLPGVPTCSAGELCDPGIDICVATCTGCVIDSVCYGDGQVNPTNHCQHCAKERSTDSWSDNDGARCEDELFCTVDDTCIAGECRGTTRRCDDGVSCNGTESCAEETNRCLPGVPTCHDHELCDPSMDSCVTTCTGCVIGGACYGNGQLNPTNPCEHCAVDRSTDSWSDNDGARCDDEVFCNGRDTCLAGECVVHTNDACPDDTFFCNGEEICNEATDRCEHSGYPCPPDALYCNGIESCSEELEACLSSGDPCADGEECFEAEGRCCERDHSIGCDDWNVVWLDSCGRPGAFIAGCSPDHSTCVSGSCVCDLPWSGETCHRCVIHVNGDDGDDSNDGTSWTAALKTVHAALTMAEASCEIWVTRGTYYPSTNSTFQLVAHVGLYGGFNGSELSRDERDVETNETVLSGDVDRNGYLDDGNVHHVVTGVDDATLDGFTITEGYARGDYPDYYGGGMFNDDASPTVSNCNFTRNRAEIGGAGMFNRHSSPMVSNCSFSENRSDFEGGGMYNKWSSPTVTNCIFLDNSADYEGGGMYNIYSPSPTISNCIFSGNSSPNGGGIFNGYSSSPTIVDSTFSGNTADYNGGAMNNQSSSPTMMSCTFSGNSASWGGGMSSYESSPTVIGCTFSDNRAAYDGGGISNTSSSITVIGCAFWSNSAEDNGGGLDLNINIMSWFRASLDMINTTIAANSAGEYGGGLLCSNTQCSITNSILWDNTAARFTQLGVMGFDGSSEVSFCTISGGWREGVHVIEFDPLFQDTATGDLRLSSGSPCIDSGSSADLPLDTTDLDDDGVTAEFLPLDIDGNPRITDGNGDGMATVDMGAYEY